MSYVQSQLVSGEKIIFQLRRTGLDYFRKIFGLVISLGLIFVPPVYILAVYFPKMTRYLAAPYPDPMLKNLAFPAGWLFIILSTLFGVGLSLLFIRDLFMAEVAFTEHRLLGRLHTRQLIFFRRFDIPVNQVTALFFQGGEGKINIQTPDGDLVFVATFLGTQSFVEQVNDFLDSRRLDQGEEIE